jgi:hypothetical protein
LTVLFFLSAAVTVNAEEAPNAGRGVPPIFVTVHASNRDKGEFELTTRMARLVTEQRTRQIERDGKLQEVIVSVAIPIYEEKVLGTISLDSSEVFEAEGKKLNNDDVKKRVTDGMTVLISADGKKVDAKFLKLLAKDTLVFVSEQLAKPAPIPAGRRPVGARN